MRILQNVMLAIVRQHSDCFCSVNLKPNSNFFSKCRRKNKVKRESLASAFQREHGLSRLCRLALGDICGLETIQIELRWRVTISRDVACIPVQARLKQLSRTLKSCSPAITSATAIVYAARTARAEHSCGNQSNE